MIAHFGFSVVDGDLEAAIKEVKKAGGKLNYWNGVNTPPALLTLMLPIRTDTSSSWVLIEKATKAHSCDSPPMKVVGLSINAEARSGQRVRVCSSRVQAASQPLRCSRQTGISGRFS